MDEKKRALISQTVDSLLKLDVPGLLVAKAGIEALNARRMIEQYETRVPDPDGPGGKKIA